ncbi:Periplasmic binding protein-related protein (fragment) [Candidatus Sulfobium mesophilum]|uniref:Periplasmic binding protein-related protein n=1 Tax=Candidatus Sulfobium mesophilum TaxID=2016548 RepID=A0A2U3QE76_9BACT
MNKSPNLLVFFLSMFFAASLWFTPGLQQQAAGADEKEYTVGVVPQFEQRKLYAVWKPIIEDLEKKTGITLSLKSTLTIQAFEKAIARGDFDFVYLNPYHLVQVHDTQGYTRL